MFALFSFENQDGDIEDRNERASFQAKLSRMSGHGILQDPTWNNTRLKAFEAAVTNEMRQFFPTQNINFTVEKDEKFEQQLYIEVETIGENIKSCIALGLIYHPDCPRNLPSLIAVEFNRQVK
jgi:hypothetical protein